MHIEDIFEDLEAQFEAALQKTSRDPHTENIRAIEIQTNHSIARDLIAPIFGKEFIAGLDSVAAIWHVYPSHAIRKIVLHGEADESLPKLKILAADLESFLRSLPTPCQIRWRLKGKEDHLQTGVLHAVTQNLIFIYSPSSLRPFAVPIAALGQLSIESVDNLNGNF